VFGAIIGLIIAFAALGKKKKGLRGSAVSASTAWRVESRLHRTRRESAIKNRRACLQHWSLI
jgi:hypothetical protein